MTNYSLDQHMFNQAMNTLEFLQRRSLYKVKQTISDSALVGDKGLDDKVRKKADKFLLNYKRIEIGIRIISDDKLKEEAIKEIGNCYEKGLVAERNDKKE